MKNNGLITIFQYHAHIVKNNLIYINFVRKYSIILLLKFNNYYTSGILTFQEKYLRV